MNGLLCRTGVLLALLGALAGSATAGATPPPQTPIPGCVAPLSFGPFFSDGSLMRRLVGVQPGARIEDIAAVRRETGSSIDLFQYSPPNHGTAFAGNSDFATAPLWSPRRPSG